MQITVRFRDRRLESRLLTLAEREGLSLNEAAVELLRRGAGLDATAASGKRTKALHKLGGTWSEQDKRAFDEATAVFGHVDPELWA